MSLWEVVLDPTDGSPAVARIGSSTLLKTCASLEEADAYIGGLNGFLNGVQAPNATDADDDTNSMIQAIDASLDEALDILDGYVDALPAEVQQAIALIYAADAVIDELMDELGIFDADDDDDKESAATRKKGSKRPNPFAAFLAKKKDATPMKEKSASSAGPYGDVAYADPKNKKYPIDTQEHCRAAWSYINQAKNAAMYPMNGVMLDSVKSKIRAACKRFGIQISG